MSIKDLQIHQLPQYVTTNCKTYLLLSYFSAHTHHKLIAIFENRQLIDQIWQLPESKLRTCALRLLHIYSI